MDDNVFKALGKSFDDLNKLGLACIKAGITNPDAIPKMVEFIKAVVQNKNGKKYTLCSEHEFEAQAILKDAGVKF